MSIHWQGLGGRGPLSRSHLFLEGLGGYVVLALLALGALIAWRPLIFGVSILVAWCLAIVAFLGMACGNWRGARKQWAIIGLLLLVSLGVFVVVLGGSPDPMND
jgi:hypothetical protein